MAELEVLRQLVFGFHQGVGGNRKEKETYLRSIGVSGTEASGYAIILNARVVRSTNWVLTPK